MFNRNNQPSNLDDGKIKIRSIFRNRDISDDISPGKYYFLVQTSSGAANKGCDVEVYGKQNFEVKIILTGARSIGSQRRVRFRR